MIPALVLILVPATAWVTGNLLLGLGVARALFAHAPAPMAPVGPDQISRALAGELFGDVLLGWYGLPLTICCYAVCAGGGIIAGLANKAGRHLTAGALMAAFVVVGLLHVQTAITVVEVGHQAADLRQAADPDSLRPAFQTLHVQSEHLVKLETVVVLVIAIAALVGLLRQRPR